MAATASIDVQTVVKRYDTLKSDRTNIDGMFTLIEKYVVPFRGNFNAFGKYEERNIEWRKREIYDSTAIQACEILSASIQGSLTSFAYKWFKLGFRDPALRDDQEAMQWLEDCENRMYMELMDSNFNVESSESYQNLTAFGTFILIEEVEDEIDWKGISFKSMEIQSCYFEHNHLGELIRLYIKYEWTAIQIADKFGLDNVPKKVAEVMNNPDSTTKKYEVVFVIMENDKVDRKNFDSSKVTTPENRPYIGFYVFKDDYEMIKLNEEGDLITGYYEMPAFVARYGKSAGSRWGFSPSMICMSDILTLNEIVKDTLSALGKVVDPANLTTERGLLSDLDLGRGGLTVVKDINDLRPYESAARFDVGELKIRHLQEAINRAFKVDQLQLKDSPQMTATEAQIRYEIMQRLLGPTLGRLESDFLDKLIHRTFAIMYRAQRFDQTPNSVLTSENQVLDIEYTGPLPRAQKAHELQNIDRWIGQLTNLSKAFPIMMQIPDAVEVGLYIGKANDIPAKLIKDPKMLRKQEKQQEAQQEHQSQMQAAAAEGAAAQQLGKGAAALANVQNNAGGQPSGNTGDGQPTQ